MEPAVGENSWVLVFTTGFRKRAPQRFDIVRLKEPGGPDHWMIKRIVGLPGEVIALVAGELIVNGAPVAEPHAYCPDPQSDNIEWWPRNDEYIVLGDNRSHSLDSRKFGPVKRSSIRGRVRI